MLNLALEQFVKPVFISKMTTIHNVHTFYFQLGSLELLCGLLVVGLWEVEDAWSSLCLDVAVEQTVVLLPLLKL